MARRSSAEYQNPLVERYSSPEMIRLFSADTKFRTWRRLWIALAEAERRLGLPVTSAQIAEMRRAADSINYDAAEHWERRLRHDVMAHIRAFGEQCPRAKGIIHLGATSAYVVDNTDLVVMREAVRLLRAKCAALCAALGRFAGRMRSVPTLAFTHLQAAQPTTVGKRAAGWAQEFLLDLDALDFAESQIRFLGAKGATGTQASFLKLFDGDARKVDRLDLLVTRAMGFDRRFLVTGQTYPRKVDSAALAACASIAQSAHKFTNDLRVLQSRQEMEEPFEEEQVGSSAMPYKRNPMRAERVAALARFALCGAQNASWTAAAQFFERTLDDSANKRLAIAETFLAADAILILCLNIVEGWKVHREVIRRHVAEELPFLATENVMMEAVRRGGDRQVLHERIRVHTRAAAERIKAGGANDLPERIASDPAFAKVRGTLTAALDPSRYVGRAPAQVDDFLRLELRPRLRRIRGMRAGGEVRV